ncbi:MAG: hypothetical protein KKD77_23260, partial [Gammaproteobacteria bacterium]|nr:hypothetical protein [Gammaproteobacteria bacterium]
PGFEFTQPKSLVDQYIGELVTSKPKSAVDEIVGGVKPMQQPLQKNRNILELANEYVDKGIDVERKNYIGKKTKDSTCSTLVCEIYEKSGIKIPEKYGTNQYVPYFERNLLDSGFSKIGDVKLIQPKDILIVKSDSSSSGKHAVIVNKIMPDGIEVISEPGEEAPPEKVTYTWEELSGNYGVRSFINAYRTNITPTEELKTVPTPEPEKPLPQKEFPESYASMLERGESLKAIEQRIGSYNQVVTKIDESKNKLVEFDKFIKDGKFAGDEKQYSDYTKAYQDYENAYSQFDQKAVDFDINEYNRLTQQEMDVTIKDVENFPDLYKEWEIRQDPKDVAKFKNSFKAGLYGLAGMTIGFAEMALTNVKNMKGITPVQMKVGSNIPTKEINTKSIKRELPKIKAAADKMFQKQGELSSRNAFGGTIKQYIDIGDYSNAASLLGHQLIENIPQQIEMIGLSLITKNPAIGAALLSLQAAGGKYHALSKTDMAESVRMVNAIWTGLGEFWTENYLGTGRILRRLSNQEMGLFKKGLQEALKQIVINSGLGAWEEGSEEVVAQLSENFIDIITGNKNEKGELPNITDNIFDSGLVGSVMGALLAGGGTGFNYSKANIAQIKIDKAEPPLPPDVRPAEKISLEKGLVELKKTEKPIGEQPVVDIGRETPQPPADVSKQPF